MKKIIVIAIVVAIGWYGNYLYKQSGLAFMQNSLPNIEYTKETKCITKDGSVIYGSVPYGTICEKVESVEGSLTVVSSESPGQRKDKWYPSSNSSEENSRASSFKCDGRTHCSQMKSCDEAIFFLRNCPDVKMDGDNDGVPCEKQWCR
ncbi:MAG TPA: excalibur calcium-binding domain-containing protein [Candidatus Competibacteraceae bacterium]|nr:excalibur calcium-binding domain-containing protein [Candidatus Competibacteraceae bacterium]